jgi:ribonuclease VapC
MVIDTSALIAIFRAEPEAEALLRAIDATPRRSISAASYFETAIIYDDRFANSVYSDLGRFVREAGIVVEPVTRQQAEIARLAYRTYGKGRHRAALNFGDCFSYALAKALGQPLLYKGGDFALTDIDSVAY